MPTNDEYTDYLAQLQLLAQQDLAAWWANTDGTAPPVRMDTMRDAFDAIQRTYGEQAAYAAAEHLFLNRQLDEALAGEEFPEVVKPVEYKQARAGFNWATKEYRRNFDPTLMAAAKRRLDGVLVRLVAQPAHETKSRATLKAGTGFARIPEPGACTFCLKLAAMGAAYSRETIADLARFHDNCRCVGIEVKDDSQLPRINRELAEVWRASGNETAFKKELHARWIGAWPRRITNPGVKVRKHEATTHEALARAGWRLEIRAPSNIEGSKTADIYLDGVLTEIKAPEGNSKGTVVQLIREGRKQASHIVIDLHRTDMANEEALRQIDYAMRRYPEVDSVLLVTHEGKFVERRRHG